MTKEQFFLQYLLPAGQLSEFINRLAQRHYPRSRNGRLHTKFAAELTHLLWDPLNLAAAYVMTQPSAQLPQLAAALNTLKIRLEEAIPRGRSKEAQEFLSSTLSHNHASCPSSMRTALGSSLERLHGQMPALRLAILSAIGYSDETRHSWLNAIEETSKPFTAEKRVSRWRTLVRNGDWTSTVESLGLAPVPTLAASARASFGSREGILRFPTVWAMCFADESAAESSSSAGVAASATTQAAAPEKLPEYVKVVSTDKGLLQVTAAFNPVNHLSLKVRSDFKALTRGRIPVPLQASLKALETVSLIAWKELPQALQTAQDWHASQLSRMPELEKVVAEYVQSKKLEGVRKKIAENFSPEEQALLAAALKSL